MQSADYHDLRETYSSHSLAWKIRKAMVEGLSGCYGASINDIHEHSIKVFTANTPERTQQLREFLNNPSMQDSKQHALDEILRDFHPAQGNWLKDRFTRTEIKELITRGIVIESSSTDAEGLVYDITSTKRRQVILADVPPKQVDYKRLEPRQVLLLNGAKVIRKFADGRFEVPTPFTGITNEVYRNLQRHQYSFPAALSAAFGVISEELVFAVRRPDGNKTYIFLGDLLEGDELYYETKVFRPKLLDTALPGLMRHGKIKWGKFKYLGQNEFRVPRRNPTARKPYDYVTTKYLPTLARPRDMWLEWFNTEMMCDCDYELNFRNREDRTGLQMVRYTQIVGPHPRWVIRLLADNLGQKDQATLPMVYPTAFAISLMDAIKNRLYNKQGNDKSFMNDLLMTAARIYDPEKILQSQPTAQEEVLKSLYTGIKRVR